MSEPTDQDGQGDWGSGSGMTSDRPTPGHSREREGRKKAPRWTVAFLRALERCGEARAAAEDAGIDHSTAYARRRAHADFADAWDAAMYRHAVAKEQREREEAEAVRKAGFSLPCPAPSPASPSASPPERRGWNREELVVSGGRVKRVGPGRWSQAKETIFFETLAATNNITRSAAAAGVSYNAVLARRQKHRLFREKWDAVVHNAKAAIELYVVEQARKTFDPDELGTGEVTPKVTIAEAIKISQSGGRAKGGEARQPWEMSYEEQAAAMSEDEVAALRERILAKFRRIRALNRKEQLEQGWSLDERYDQMIPPGWMRDPDHAPDRPEEPGDEPR